MQAVILAGGLGTRLGDITSSIPKPMVMINNQPLILHIMKLYMSYGVKEFIICLGYKGEIIKNYFTNFNIINNDLEVDIAKKKFSYLNYNKINFKVKLIDTGLNSGTVGRLVDVEKYIKGDNFYLTYGDGLSNVDLKKLFKDHKKNNKMITFTSVRPPGRFGSIEFKNQELLSFNEKKYNTWINGGFFVIKKKALKFIKSKSDMLEEDFLQNFIKKKQVNVYKHHGLWQCIDTKRDLDHLNKLIKKNSKAFIGA